jgi:hypothetical protein
MSAPRPARTAWCRRARPHAPRHRRRTGARRTGLAALAGVLGVTAGAPLAAQAPDDGLMIPRHQLRSTVELGRDRWDHYWEGSLRRTNGNIGALTTRTAAWTLGYGVGERLSVFATLPYVWTRASQGVLQGMEGAQDLGVAAKLRAARVRVAGRTTVDAVLIAAAATPVTDYTPDFLPLSIGLGARRLAARAAVHAQDRSGWFVDGSAGHVWRANVRLDRLAYYTDGRLVLSDEVAMPRVVEYALAGGYQDATWCLPVALVAQRTLGGGDIRRQDMPFVSNRMNATRLVARAMYTLPALPALRLEAGAMHVVAGRNVGQGTTLTGGLTVAFGL